MMVGLAVFLLLSKLGHFNWSAFSALLFWITATPLSHQTLRPKQLNDVISTKERYHHFVNASPEISALVTNKLIACYLGINQELVRVIRKRQVKKNST